MPNLYAVIWISRKGEAHVDDVYLNLKQATARVRKERRLFAPIKTYLLKIPTGLLPKEVR